MKIRKREFNKSYCIPEVEINKFITENIIKRGDIINIIPIANGVELWYWG
jgi:hypothetical protein